MDGDCFNQRNLRDPFIRDDDDDDDDDDVSPGTHTSQNQLFMVSFGHWRFKHLPTSL